MDRRHFLTYGGFAASAYAAPLTGRLAAPIDSPSAHHGRRRVGQSDLEELRETAREAQLWDSKFGGGNWKSSSVARCLAQRATPLLEGTYSETVGAELFKATAELSRVVAWSMFDAGQHAIAQRHFTQALDLAKAGDDAEMSCYVLSTMALSALLRGFPDEAVTMAMGAYDRAKGVAAPRVLAFALLAGARAHGKAGDAQAAIRALHQSEDLLDRIRPGRDRDPQWLAYFGRPRLSADAVEVYRDLGKPADALRWSLPAQAMAQGRYTRAVGLQRAVVATAHLQECDLDAGLEAADQALAILSDVSSTRAHGYVTDITVALSPWQQDARVRDFVHRVRTALGTPR